MRLAACPLSRLTAPATRLPPRVLSASGRRPAPTDAAAETGRWATSHRDVAAPVGEPSKQPARGLQKAKSRLPLWGRWTRVSEDGEGSPPEACRRPSLASPFGGRWCPVGTVQRLVSAAASVGDGRSPLGCITRAGRREWTRVSEDGEGNPPAAPPQNNPCLP